MKLVVGIILGALIGMGCRVFAIPLPGPNAILGALLGIAMATGYELTDRVMSHRDGSATADSAPAQRVSAKASPESTVASPPPVP